MELEEGTRFMVLAPIVRGRKGEYGKLFEELRADGFARARSTASCGCSRSRSSSTRSYKHDIEVVVDRLVMRARRAQAPRRLDRDRGRAGGRDRRGRAVPRDGEDAAELRHVLRALRLPECGTSMPELEPRMFSFNSPHGACERCTGPGLAAGDRPRADRARPGAVDRRGRDRAVGDAARRATTSRSPRRSPSATRSTSRRRGSELPAEAARPRSCTARTASAVQVTYRNRYGRKRSYGRASRGSSRTSSAATARPTPSSRARRSRST